MSTGCRSRRFASRTLVEPTIAHAVGVTSGLATHFADRQILLLLDNVEQVIDAAPGLAELLGSCHGLKLLVTSREPLRLSGEWEYMVLPLPQTDAVALFTQRARALKADFEPMMPSPKSAAASTACPSRSNLRQHA